MWGRTHDKPACRETIHQWERGKYTYHKSIKTCTAILTMITTRAISQCLFVNIGISMRTVAMGCWFGSCRSGKLPQMGCANRHSKWKLWPHTVSRTPLRTLYPGNQLLFFNVIIQGRLQPSLLFKCLRMRKSIPKQWRPCRKAPSSSCPHTHDVCDRNVLINA